MHYETVYEKIDILEYANIYKQFFVDILKSGSLYTIARERSVQHIIKGLSNESTIRQSIGGADAEFEQIIADIMQHKFRDMITASDLGLTNAVGYDICSQGSNIFVEAKMYTITERSNRLSAMIGNMENKFCSTLILVIDPYISEETKYRLYAIPPDAIYSDTSDNFEIVHHQLTRVNPDLTTRKQCEPLGITKSIYAIEISDINNIDIFDNINIKRLSSCLRKVENLPYSTSPQEFTILHSLWNNCIRTHNKKTKFKYPIDFKDQVFDYNKSRMFYKDAKIITQELLTQDNNDEEL